MIIYVCTNRQAHWFWFCITVVHCCYSFYNMYCSYALLGMCLHGLGQYYLIVGQHREAGEAFSEAVGIAKDIYGPEDIQVVTCTFAYNIGV